MTLLTTASSVSYVGNAVTKSFDFAFKVPEGALSITLTAADGTESTPAVGSYTVSGYDDANGGLVMPEKSIPPDAVGTLVAAGWAMGWALVGRVLYVLNLVRLGKRAGFFSPQTVWELGVAIGMGVVAGGLSEYVGLSGLPAAGFIAAASYLGPQVIEMGLDWMTTRMGVPHPAASPEAKKDNEP